jgi:stage II sporulation protein D
MLPLMDLRRGLFIALMGLAGLLTITSCQIPSKPTAPEPPRHLIVPAENRHVRVRIAHGLSELPLAVDGPYRFEDERGKVLLNSAAGLAPTVARASANPHPRIEIAAGIYNTRHLYVVPTYDGSLIIDGKRYRGYLRITPDGRTITATNVLDIEDYLRGVLAAEMPSSFHPEAFKAQAIAARTYALVQRARYGRHREWDVLPDERSQMYIGVAGESDLTVNAVEATRDMVLTWDSPAGQTMFAPYYSSTCGGWTQDAVNVNLEHDSIGPLIGGVQCTYCKHSPYRDWGPVKISYAELTAAVIKRYPKYRKLGRLKRMTVTEQDPHGWAISLELTGTSGKTMKIGAYDLRRALGSRRLRSTRFQIVNGNKEVQFTEGHGFGHGAGLCQYGADGMARQGHTAASILQHYYPGATITRLPDLHDEPA